MVDPSESAELAAADSPSPPRRRLWRYMLTVLLVLAAFWCGYPALLRMVSRSLIQVDPLQSVKTLIVLDGEANWLEGAALIGLYGIIATSFWWG